MPSLPPLPPLPTARAGPLPGRRGAAAAGLLCCVATARALVWALPAAAGERRVEVWIELSAAPPPPGADAASRAAALQAIDAQQAALVAALQALGGVERGRVRLVLNAVAADLPVSAVVAARTLPGVRSLRVVQHRMRIDDGSR